MKNAPIPHSRELRKYRHGDECYIWAEEVNAEWPHLKIEHGFFLKANGEPADHAWNIAPDGIIVDVTSQQFGLPRTVIRPANPVYSRYVSFERNFERAKELEKEWNAIGYRNSGIEQPKTETSKATAVVNALLEGATSLGKRRGAPA